MSNEFPIIDDTPEEPRPPEEDRLNRQRIRAIALDRRAAHRRRLWARGVVFLFSVAAVVMVADAARLDGPRRGWFVAGAVVFVVLAIRALLRLPRFSTDIESPDTPTPDPKAFEALSDGSQFARGLDELNRRN